MKTSIFDMNFVLPPMLEMVEVEKDMPMMGTYTRNALRFPWCNVSNNPFCDS